MNATTGFFQKCQQYFNFKSPTGQNYQVGEEEESDHYEDESSQREVSGSSTGLSSRFSFQRSYQKVSTEDKLTKYDDFIMISFRIKYGPDPQPPFSLVS